LCSESGDFGSVQSSRRPSQAFTLADDQQPFLGSFDELGVIEDSANYIGDGPLLIFAIDPESRPNRKLSARGSALTSEGRRILDILSNEKSQNSDGCRFAEVIDREENWLRGPIRTE